MKTILYIITTCLVAMGFSSCSKEKDLLQAPASFSTFIYINNSTIPATDLGVKYNGGPLGTLVLTGIGKFTFYNKTTGEVLLEKEIDIKAGDREPWYFFQPDASIAPQLIRNTQLDEPQPPAGYFKLKIVNLAKNSMPLSKLDVILKYYDINGLLAVHETLERVGSQLDTASYYIVKEQPAAYGFYTLSFKDHDTQQSVLDKSGNEYLAQLGIYLDPAKHMFIFYLSEIVYDAYDGYIYKNDKYYDIYPVELF